MGDSQSQRIDQGEADRDGGEKPLSSFQSLRNTFKKPKDKTKGITCDDGNREGGRTGTGDWRYQSSGFLQDYEPGTYSAITRDARLKNEKDAATSNEEPPPYSLDTEEKTTIKKNAFQELSRMPHLRISRKLSYAEILGESVIPLSLIWTGQIHSVTLGWAVSSLTVWARIPKLQLEM